AHQEPAAYRSARVRERAHLAAWLDDLDGVDAPLFLIAGGLGTGKTTLLTDFVTMARSRGIVVVEAGSPIGLASFALRRVADQLGINSEDINDSQLSAHIRASLRAFGHGGRHCVIVVDDVHRGDAAMIALLHDLVVNP